MVIRTGRCFQYSNNAYTIDIRAPRSCRPFGVLPCSCLAKRVGIGSASLGFSASASVFTFPGLGIDRKGVCTRSIASILHRNSSVHRIVMSGFVTEADGGRVETHQRFGFYHFCI
jgi:hypothetical protein